MVASIELHELPVFTCLDADQLSRLAEHVADVRLGAGEYLVREGDQSFFFVLMSGEMRLTKEVGGRGLELARYKPGDFFGEVPVLLGTPAFVSVQAVTEVRVARFEPQQLRELVQSSAACSAIILQTMMSRLSNVETFQRQSPVSRVLIVGTRYDEDCSDIRRFLSANRISFEWVDKDRNPERIPPCMAQHHFEGPAVVVDKSVCVDAPTVRTVAQALKIRTEPKNDKYDVVVVGGGPAGMAAGVYAASEGLSVLIVERDAAGGQAGTSSRIENYLGFPNGISGEELSVRALAQAERFGAEITMTRCVERLEKFGEGYCLQLEGGRRISCKVVLLATGVEWRMLEAEGVDRLRGRGVVYGASRNEANSVVGKQIFIVGGGNSAGQAAMFFSNYAAQVRVLVRGEGLELTMSNYLVDQIATKRNITIEPYTQVVRALGEDSLEALMTRTQTPGVEPREQTRLADALFVMIGADAQTAWLPQDLQRDSRGYICTGRDLTTWPLSREPFPLETSLPGVFCAGDVRHDSIKRVSSGVGEGSMAVAFIHQYLASTVHGTAAFAN